MIVLFYDTNGIPQPVDVSEGSVHILMTDSSGLSIIEDRKQTPTGQALNVQIGEGDPISNIPVVMDFEHHQVHEGESYKSINKQTSLGTNTVKYSITVPVFPETIRAPHMVIGAEVYNGVVLVDIYAEASATDGSPITSNNRNRNSSNVASTGIKTGVTSTDGTLIDSFYCGAGSKTAVTGRSSAEWVLKSNKTYRVDVIGQAAGTAAIVFFEWYEDLGV